MKHPPTHARHRTPQILRGVAALAALIFLLAGVPAGLYLVGGSPIPHSVPSWPQVSARLAQPDTDNTLFLAVVRLIGWAAWAIFTTTTLAEAISFIRGHSLRRLPAPVRPLQYLARDLIATAALIFTTAGPIAGSAAATAGHHQTVAITTDQREPSPAVPASGDRAAASPQPALSITAQSAATHPPAGHTWRTATIRHGDTLWAIARHAYGSGARYPTIFNASEHLHQPAGLPPLRDPDKIYPGQHIKIPASANPGTRQRPPATPQRKNAPPDVSRPTATPPTPRPFTPQPSRPASPHPSSTKSAPAPPATPPPAASTPPTPPAHTPPPATAHPTPSSGSTPPTRPPAASASPAPHTPPTGTASAPPASEQHHDGPVTVTLRTGGYIGLGLATMISIALAATRLHRRHRRTYSGEWPPTSTPDPAPPPAVAQVRKAHLDVITDQGEPVPSDEDLISADFTAPTPTHLTVGVHAQADDQTNHGAEITIDLSGLSLGLTGPGAPHAARAILTELLARSRRSRVELLIPIPDAAALLAGTGITAEQLADAVPGLILTPSLTSAVAHLEAEFVHRARLMESLDEPDVPALRAADPSEPLPALVLIAALPDHQAPALHAILQHARPYCVGGLLLGTWPAGTTLTLADDATVTNVDGPDTHTWTGARLFHVTPYEATGLLHVVRTANGAPETKQTGTTNGPTSPPIGPNSTTDPGSQTAPAADTPNQTANPEHALPTPPSRATSPTDDSATNDQPIHLRLLGAVQVHAAGTPITTGLRRAAYDLLAYLALSPDGVTRDQAIDAIWPDKTPETGAEMWHTAITNIRKTLRTATGLREPMFVIRAAARYRLDPHLIDVDLWRLLKLLTAAQQTDDDTERLAILQQVPDLYTAELATDLTCEWAESHREHLRRHGTDALVYLARLTQNDNPDQALAALEQAITHDPYAEPLYRAIMSIQARLGRLDAARRTYQLLQTKLTELDIDPSEQTHQHLLSLLRPTPRQPPTSNQPSDPFPAPPKQRRTRATTAHPARRHDQN